MPQYQKINNRIFKLKIDNPETEDSDLDWININNAGKKEIEYLRKNYGFNIDHLRSSAANVFSQRPMIIEEEKYVFIIFHFPKLEDKKIVADEIEFFIGHGHLITIHNDNKIINNFFGYCKKDISNLLSFKMESSAVLLYEILSKLLKNCYSLLDESSIAIKETEKIVFQQEQKKAVSIILELRHNIINIRRIIQNYKNLLKKLVDLKSTLVPSQEIKKLYNELVEHSKRIWEMLDNQKEIIEALNSTNESFLNYRMSNIMKTLTIFSVIVFPLSLLAAIFGMNNKYMPLINGRYDFWIIISMMVFGSSIMLFIFGKKNWLK
jgi:magnesium transporter